MTGACPTHVLCASQPWSAKGVEGVHRFLARAYRLVTGGLSDQPPDGEQLRLVHATIKKVNAGACHMLLCERQGRPTA